MRKIIQQVRYFLAAALFVSATLSIAAEPAPEILFPASGVTPATLALIVNSKDPLSVKIAKYYQQQRKLPEENIVYIAFNPGQQTMEPGVFAVINRQVELSLPDNIQAYLLTWVQPFRVGCMSITSAFAFGYDVNYCAKGCKPTKINPYAASNSHQPFDDFSIRPTMMLAALNMEQAKQLIDRGVQANQNQIPIQSAAYLLETSDKNRNVRKQVFSMVSDVLASRLAVNIEQADSIKNKKDIMFYFTGLKFVEDIDKNDYLPGAMADHLTSTGGVLVNGFQMSVLRWLEAGATGSYGTVVEPCNIILKFPNPMLAMANYIRGDTLIEAYWKSVYMPGQGVFIGEPLAQPYKGYTLLKKRDNYELRSLHLSAGYYQVFAADKREGPYKRITSGIEVSIYDPKIDLQPPFYKYYKVKFISKRQSSSKPISIRIK